MSTKVLLLKRYASPRGNWPSGTTIEVPESEAGYLVAAGAAEMLESMQPFVKPTEVAAKAAAKRETATNKAVLKRETATEK